MDKMARRQNYIFKLIAIVFFFFGMPLVLASTVAGYSLLSSVADDAFFFYRYALNYVNNGRMSWLPGGPPEYGSTSQLYQWVVLLSHAIFPSVNELILPLLSLFFGLLAIISLVVIVYSSADNDAQFTWAAVVSISLGGLQAKLFNHFISGMETTFSTLMVSLFILCLILLPQHRRLLSSCLFVPILYLSRPEAALIPGFTALTIFITTTPKDWFKTDIIWPVLTSLLSLLLLLLFFWIVFRTALPTSFYIKSFLTPYSHEAINRYEFGNINEFYQIIRSHSIHLMLFFFALSIIFFGSLRQNIWEAGLLIGLIAFLMFCVFGNRIPVSTGDARFFMPALPVIVYFAGKAAWALWGLTDHIHGIAAGRTIVLAALASVMAVQAPPGFRSIWSHLITPALQCKLMCWDNSSRLRSIIANIERQDKWGGFIHAAKHLPPRCSLADTEVGAIGALNWRRPILDYSGLNNLELARSKDPVELLNKQKPDFVFLDRISWYWSINQKQIDLLYQDFIPVTDETKSSTLFARRDSKCL